MTRVRWLAPVPVSVLRKAHDALCALQPADRPTLRHGGSAKTVGRAYPDLAAVALKRLGPEPLIDPTARVEHCQIGRYTEVGARTSLIETEFGDYSYVVHDSEIIYSRIGKFCS